MVRKIKTLSPYCMPGLKYKPKNNPHSNNEKGRDRHEWEYILDIGCEYFSIKKDHILSKTRPDRIVYPRHCVMYLMCLLTDLSLNEIAVIFNKKDHTTVIHARDTISENIEVNSFVRATGSYVADDISKLKKLINKKK